jgi:hypothetical protein
VPLFGGLKQVETKPVHLRLPLLIQVSQHAKRLRANVRAAIYALSSPHFVALQQKISDFAIVQISRNSD